MHASFSAGHHSRFDGASKAFGSAFDKGHTPYPHRWAPGFGIDPDDNIMFDNNITFGGNAEVRECLEPEEMSVAESWRTAGTILHFRCKIPSAPVPYVTRSQLRLDGDIEPEQIAADFTWMRHLVGRGDHPNLLGDDSAAIERSRAHRVSHPHLSLL